MDCDIFALLTLEDSERRAVLTYNKSKRKNRWLFSTMITNALPVLNIEKKGGEIRTDQG